MRIGVPTEIKTHEYRVGLTPESVKEIAARGHQVFVQSGAGAGIDADDATYANAGAEILPTAIDVFDTADLIVKVKEPQLSECALLKAHQSLFTYLHLAADKAQADALCASGATAIAYETVTDAAGRLPLLRPMSEVAGRMAAQVAATTLEKPRGGRGILMGGVTGTAPARVVVLGGGVAGLNAALMAAGLRADVTVFDRSADRLAEIDLAYGDRLTTSFATQTQVDDAVYEADVVIGAVLVPGAAAPRLVRREMLKDMKPGAVLVDISIDQGGCFETSRPTTHDEPTFLVDGIVHYCVANMPGAMSRTSTYALNNATLPYVLDIIDNGIEKALQSDLHLAAGLNVKNGTIRHAAVAESLDAVYVPYAA